MVWYQKTQWTSAKKQTVNGIKYDSKFEAGYAEQLELRVKGDDIKRFEAHVKIPLIVNGQLIWNYYIDFKIWHNDGTIEYVETKGAQFEVWKSKWRLFNALYGDNPDVKITLIQQGNYKPPRLRKIK